MAAAIKVIASQGLAAPTAMIAKEAGVSNGSLFTYFPTKADLLNRLYLEVKTEAAEVALEGLPAKANIRKQALHMWMNSVQWAVSSPDKRRALALLTVSDDITPASRRTGHEVMAGVAKLIDQSRESGPLRTAPLQFVVAIMSALTDATVEFMIKDRANAKKHCIAGFDALWRAIT
jgi:AcrR family transcriptional regulator